MIRWRRLVKDYEKQIDVTAGIIRITSFLVFILVIFPVSIIALQSVAENDFSINYYNALLKGLLFQESQHNELNQQKIVLPFFSLHVHDVFL